MCLEFDLSSFYWELYNGMCNFWRRHAFLSFEVTFVSVLRFVHLELACWLDILFIQLTLFPVEVGSNYFSLHDIVVPPTSRVVCG